MDVQKIYEVDSVAPYTTRGWCGNEPQRFVLRDDADVATLLERLEELGVTELRYLIRSREDEGHDVFPMIPAFKNGAPLWSRRLQEASRLGWRLGNFIADAVQEALLGTSADGHDLLIMADVIINNPGGPRAISTWVTVIRSCEAEFEDREIQLL